MTPLSWSSHDQNEVCHVSIFANVCSAPAVIRSHRFVLQPSDKEVFSHSITSSATEPPPSSDQNGALSNGEGEFRSPCARDARPAPSPRSQLPPRLRIGDASGPGKVPSTRPCCGSECPASPSAHCWRCLAPDRLRPRRAAAGRAALRRAVLFVRNMIHTKLNV